MFALWKWGFNSVIFGLPLLYRVINLPDFNSTVAQIKKKHQIFMFNNVFRLNIFLFALNLLIKGVFIGLCVPLLDFVCLC